MILGINALGVFAIAPTRLTDYASLVPVWWAWMAAAVIIVMSVALIVVGSRRRPEFVGHVALGGTAGYLIVVALWFATWSGDTVVDRELGAHDLWVILIPQIIGCLFVLGEHLASALGTVIVAGGLSLAMAAAASGHTDWRELIQAIWILALTSLYQVIAWTVITGARRYDDESSAAAADAVRRMHDRAQDSEERRLDAMVHDRLIAILLALRPGPVKPAGRRAITSVLDEIADWRSDQGPGATRVPAAELAQRLRLSLDEIDDRVEVEIDADTDADHPADVVDAIIDAVGEAVRNFHRHAGAGAACAVLGDIRSDAIAVTIVDDGVGFDVDAVPANRIGVALGIVERMHLLPGGDGRVESEHGVGTRVQLSWSAPEVGR